MPIQRTGNTGHTDGKCKPNPTDKSKHRQLCLNPCLRVLSNLLRSPNLSADQTDLKRFEDIGHGVENATSFRVKVIFGKDDVVFFDSLVDLWSVWYSLYFDATYPHLIIRFEDMLLQAPAVLSKIAECVGTDVRNPIQYQTGSAKAHGSHTDFLKAILKSADAEKRSNLLAQRDLDYAAAKLDPELIDAFQYKLIR